MRQYVGCVLLSFAVFGCGSGAPSPMTFPFGGDVRQIVGAKWNEENGVLNEHDGWTLHPIQATVTFPSGRQFSTFSRTTFATQRRGRLVSLTLTPNRQPLEFDQAVKLVESLASDLKITNHQNYQRAINQWKTNPPKKSDVFQRSFVARPEDDVEIFVAIKSYIDPLNWYVHVKILSESAFAQENPR